MTLSDAASALAARVAREFNAIRTTLSHKVDETDPRLSDARTPTQHYHPGSDILDATPVALASTVVVRDSAGDAAFHELRVASASTTDAAVPKSYVDNALAGYSAGVSAPTPNTSVKRDAAGRAQMVDPAVAADIATKGYIDGQVTTINTALAGKAATSHVHAITDLTATGTRSATTFLRGDGTWATPAGASGTLNQAGTVARLRQNVGTAGSASAYNTLTWHVADIDNYAGWSASTNPSRWTVPAGQDGIYALRASASVSSIADAGTIAVRIQVNGAIVQGSSEVNTTGVAGSLSADSSATVSLVAGDYVEVQLYCTGAYTTRVTSSDGVAPWFEAEKIALPTASLAPVTAASFPYNTTNASDHNPFYQLLKYWVENGNLHLVGVMHTNVSVANGASLVIGTLPVGFRPAAAAITSTVSDAKVCNIYIGADGVVSLNNQSGAAWASGTWWPIDVHIFLGGNVAMLASPVTAPLVQASFPFSANAANYGSGYLPAKYWLANGTVYLEGLVAISGSVAAGASVVIGTMPPGYRPTSVSLNVSIFGMASTYAARIDVGTDGTVTFFNPTGATINGANYLSLRLEYFIGGQTSLTAAPASAPLIAQDFPFNTNASNYVTDGSFAGAKYWLANGTVYLQGLAKTNVTLGTATATTIGTLPTGYRPAQKVLLSVMGNNGGINKQLRLDIAPDGTVQVINNSDVAIATGNFVTIEGSYFVGGNASLATAAVTAPMTFTDFPFTSAASNYVTDGSYTGNSRYWLNNGQVFVQGAAKITASLAPGARVQIGTMPPGYRPDRTIATIGMAYSSAITVGRVDFSADGSVWLENDTANIWAANAWFTLNASYYVGGNASLVTIQYPQWQAALDSSTFDLAVSSAFADLTGSSATIVLGVGQTLDIEFTAPRLQMPANGGVALRLLANGAVIDALEAFNNGASGTLMLPGKLAGSVVGVGANVTFSVQALYTVTTGARVMASAGGNVRLRYRIW